MDLLGLAFGALALFLALASLAYVWRLDTNFKAHSHPETRYNDEKPKPKILVPGRGIFQQAKEKRVPKYWREDELWAKEQDER